MATHSRAVSLADLESALNRTLPTPGLPDDIDLDSPLLLREQAPFIPREAYKNPAAEHLFKHGLVDKADAREDCQKYAHFEQCDGSVSPRGDKHITTLHLSCRQRYCKYCGPRRSRENLERWYAGHPYLRKRNNFTYLEIARDFEGVPMPQVFEYFNDDVAEFSDLAEKGRVAGTGAVWNTVIRRLPDGKIRLVAKFIWWGDLSEGFDPDNWWQNPDIQVIRHETVPVCSLDTALKHIFDQEIPTDAIDSAHFEMIIHEKRTVRSVGGFIRSRKDSLGAVVESNPNVPGAYDISEELFPREAIGNNSPEYMTSTPGSIPQPKKPPRTCHVCGAAIIRRSERVFADIDPGQIPYLTWFDIQPPG